MADQLRQGDEEIKNTTATAESASVSQKAQNGFMHDYLADADKNSRVTSGKAVASASGDNVSAKSPRPADGYSIKKLVKEGRNPDASPGSSEKDSKHHIKDNNEQLNKIRDLVSDFLKPDGVKQLPTGDTLVRDEGKETLFTPKGDKVTVNPDGTFNVKGDLKSVSTDKTGATTITFGDGARVTIDKEGIRDVSRGKQAVSFTRLNREQFKPIEGGHGGSSPVDNGDLGNPAKSGQASGNDGGPRPSCSSGDIPNPGQVPSVELPSPKPSSNDISRPGQNHRIESPNLKPQLRPNDASLLPSTGHESGSRPTNSSGDAIANTRPLKPVLPNIEIK